VDQGEPARPAPPRPPPVQVAVSAGVSASVAGEVVNALRLIPARVQSALDARGVRVEVARRVVDVRPHLAGVRPRGWPAGLSYENADACYDRGVVVVAEVHADYTTGQEVPSGRVAGVTRHEVGHAADEVYGNFSRDPAFRAAYNADVAAIRANNTPVDPYFLQGGDAGPEETFAEGFAQMYGGGIDSMTPNFPGAFHRTLHAMRQQLR
jgi:hypothetical protein